MFSSDRIAWLVVAVLLVVFGFAAAGKIDLRAALSPFGSNSYPDARERIAGADKSQALHMRLEGQYPGPLQDTVIERWSDPVDGTVCYVYLPIAVAHAAGPAGLVQYGSANIGSISCMKGGS
jgi:hypothetical protein